MLAFTAPPTYQDALRAIIACGKIAYERHLLMANDGNISVRLKEGILITASGVCKGRLTPADILWLNMDGTLRRGADGKRPSSETPMHLEVYRQRPDIYAVLHAHPVFATTLTVAGQDFPLDVLPEVLLTLGEVPVTAYATPSSHEDAEVIRELIRSHDALLLRQHGSLTVGPHLDAALTHLERIEHVSEVYWRARMLGQVNHIPPEALARLNAVRRQMTAGTDDAH